MACPYAASHGFTTLQARKHWMAAHDKANVDESLHANLDDPDSPLYFWQLYSLLGSDKIIGIVRAFYERVYADDDEEWLRDAFISIRPPLNHHVATQSAFWIDAFGGGRQYHGSEYRLSFHHSQQEVLRVMNARGAARWMHHMALALNVDTDFRHEDPRVKPCIVDFLETRMRKYALAHGWEFDPYDFDSLKLDATGAEGPTGSARATRAVSALCSQVCSTQ